MDGSEQLNIHISLLFPGKTFIATLTLRELAPEADGDGDDDSEPLDRTFFEETFYEGPG